MPTHLAQSEVKDPLSVENFLLESLLAMETVLSQRTQTCPLEMNVWGHVYPLQEFSASSNLLAKSREAWSSLVFFILFIGRSFLEGNSPNEAKQQTILNILKQLFPLYNGLRNIKF